MGKSKLQRFKRRGEDEFRKESASTKKKKAPKGPKKKTQAKALWKEKGRDKKACSRQTEIMLEAGTPEEQCRERP